MNVLLYSRTSRPTPYSNTVNKISEAEDLKDLGMVKCVLCYFVCHFGRHVHLLYIQICSTYKSTVAKLIT
jgi:hypothetical protein